LPERAGIRRRLLAWYDRNRRDLPWRRRRDDAYAQWVAEIMLQQTRVETVVDYYDRFMRRFPDANALASASHDEVLKCWEGLGYYRRALHMHRAARLLFDAGRGVPTDADGLRELPGVGDYTAAAIASIAGGQRVAAVDGNVARVLARLFGVEEDVLSAPGRSAIGNLASQLVPRGRAGDFNQAWMDLGSMVCTPKSPDCERCPLRTVCAACAAGRTADLPVRGAGGGRGVPEIRCAVGVFVRDGCVLVRRRPKGGLWSGLWEFPSVELGPARVTARHVHALARGHHLTLTGRLGRVGTVSHKLTHRLYVFHVYSGQVAAGDGRQRNRSLRWTTISGLKRLSMSTGHRRVLGAAQEASDLL
jgi:A/G-specific adenine glycosylase